MRRRSVSAMVISCALASIVTAHASGTTPVSSTTPTGETARAPAPGQPIEFRDHTGKTITSNQFTAAVKNGQRYTARKDMQEGRIVMVLLPAGVNTPGSRSWADMTGSSFTMLSINGVHYRVLFRDERGKAIDQETFASGALEHQRYTTQLNRNKGTAALTLLPIGVNKPGSQPTSLWAAKSGPSLALVPKPGVRFAGFDLPRIGGGRIDSAVLKGKPYVVDFFFADCIGCIAELPVLNAYHKRYPRRQVLAITFDDAKTAAGFVKQRHFDWPVAYNGKSFTDKLGIEVYPTMVVVGAYGKVLATRIGEHTSATPKSLENWIAQSIQRSHQSSDTR